MMTLDPNTGAAGLAAAYGPRVRAMLTDSILPFWHRTLDAERGGVFNCWNNAGTQLVSRDKFTWSQGRFLWLWSRLAELARRGLIAGEPEALLGHAAKTAQFLQRHAFLDDGRCALLLSEDGRPREAFADGGLAPSIYADCFVAMGFAEFARASGNAAMFETAWRLARDIERRIGAGQAPTMPEPVPPGFDSHALAMIQLNLAVVLHEAGVALDDARREMTRERARAGAQRIFEAFLLPGGRLRELRAQAGDDDVTLLGRHFNPGHALECLWLLLTVARWEQREDWLARAAEAVHFALARGWDDEQGGLLHYVDAEGGEPNGHAGDSYYEAGVRRTWDTKLWWVHSEALYATALGGAATGNDELARWFERVWEYAARVFPHPDPVIGEWIQIRDRRGAPLDRVVALPVKDPYHIARNLIQVLELFAVPARVLP